MRNHVVFVLALLMTTFCLSAQSAEMWTEGRHYFLIQPAQPVVVPAGKIEVTEVFSYGCPGCNQFQPIANRLRISLPTNAQFVCVAASWLEHEDWPMFQRAFYTAQVLGVAERAHDAMFDAVWKTGELAVVDPQTQRLRKTLPSIDDAARFYAHATGVTATQFAATAKSFGVDLSMKRADALIMGYRADSTPTIVVSGKYRVTPASAGGNSQLIDLVKWLVARETK